MTEASKCLFTVTFIVWRYRLRFLKTAKNKMCANLGSRSFFVHLLSSLCLQVYPDFLSMFLALQGGQDRRHNLKKKKTLTLWGQLHNSSWKAAHTPHNGTAAEIRRAAQPHRHGSSHQRGDPLGAPRPSPLLCSRTWRHRHSQPTGEDYLSINKSSAH